MLKTHRPAWLFLILLASWSAASAQRPSTAPGAIKIPFEAYHAAERTDGDSLARPHHANGCRERLVSRRLEERGVGPDRLRAPVRAVMFTGSGNVPYGLHDRLTEGVGGINNGSTDNDRTNYYETVPSNYLEIGAVARVRSHGLPARHVRSRQAERAARHREERAPAGRGQPAVRARSGDPRGATYPTAHPYSWPVIGSMEDLSAASEEDVKNFFRLYYAPNNAFLTIVGDFDPAQAKAWVSEVFRRYPAREADHAASGRGRSKLDGRDSGWSLKIACRCRVCTCSGRRSA